MVAKAQYSIYNFPYFGGQTLRRTYVYAMAMGPFVIIDQEKTNTKFLVVMILPSTKSMTNDCD